MPKVGGHPGEASSSARRFPNLGNDGGGGQEHGATSWAQQTGREHDTPSEDEGYIRHTPRRNMKSMSTDNGSLAYVHKKKGIIAGVSAPWTELVIWSLGRVGIRAPLLDGEGV